MIPKRNYSFKEKQIYREISITFNPISGIFTASPHFLGFLHKLNYESSTYETSFYQQIALRHMNVNNE